MLCIFIFVVCLTITEKIPDSFGDVCKDVLLVWNLWLILMLLLKISVIFGNCSVFWLDRVEVSPSKSSFIVWRISCTEDSRTGIVVEDSLLLVSVLSLPSIEILVEVWRSISCEVEDGSIELVLFKSSVEVEVVWIAVAVEVVVVFSVCVDSIDVSELTSELNVGVILVVLLVYFSNFVTWKIN